MPEPLTDNWLANAKRTFKRNGYVNVYTLLDEIDRLKAELLIKAPPVGRCYLCGQRFSLEYLIRTAKGYMCEGGC